MKVHTITLTSGHEILSARQEIEAADCVLVTCGDKPPLRPETVSKLVECITARNQDAAVLFTVLDDPAGHRRILRDGYGDVKGFVEHCDATVEQRAIREVDACAYCFHRDLLLFALDHMDRNNDQKEYRLTDAIAIIANMGGKVADVRCEPEECMKSLGYDAKGGEEK